MYIFYVKQFSNLCGAVYRQGNVLFTNDGDSVFSPVGNRISQFDLKRYLLSCACTTCLGCQCHVGPLQE